MIPTRLSALQWSLLVCALVVGLLYLLGDVLTPFVAAGIVAYICHPLVLRLERCKLPRTWATLLVLLALAGCLVVMVLILWPMLQSEVDLLLQRLPGLVESLHGRLLPVLQTYVDPSLAWDASALKSMLSHVQQPGDIASRTLLWVGSGGMVLLDLLLNLLLIPLALFYLLRDWPQLLARIDNMIPRRWHEHALRFAQETDAVLAGFLRGQFMVMLLMGLYYVSVLSLCRLQFALPVGVVTGMLVFVPYLGVATGLILSTLIALTQYDQISGVLGVWLVFGIGHLLESMVITPRLVGERIGLHPLTVVFALMAFGHVFGFFGVLLALPLSAVLQVGLNHLRAWYLGSTFYNN